MIAALGAVLANAETTGSVYTWFFVQSRAPAPNEIMGVAYPLFVVVVLLSSATALGVVPLVLSATKSLSGAANR